MPIRQEMKSKYPPRKEWLALRARILARAENCCEFCRVKNHEFIVRGLGSLFRYVSGMEIDAATLDGEKVVKVVLTIAHLDHQPENCADDNLRALCQRCHLRHDAKEHRFNAEQTRGKRRAKAIPFTDARHA